VRRINFHYLFYFHLRVVEIRTSLAALMRGRENVMDFLPGISTPKMSPSNAKAS
jgi:hypothetical protein